MKQFLLFVGIASSIVLHAQNTRKPRDFGEENRRMHRAELKFRAIQAPDTTKLETTVNRPTYITWQALCGSMNVYGMLLSGQHPLQYNPKLNAISFIHRKSDYYNCSPAVPTAAESGVIVAEISTNGGISFDSTCVWSNANEWGRYPQGGIYNPPSNTLIANAQIVGSGVTVNSTGFSGTWYASKSLTAINNSASTVPSAQQAFSFLNGPYSAAMPRHGWMSQGFTVTDDGIAHAVGVLGDDLSNTTSMRGYAVLTGSFNGQTFDWSIDSLLPNAVKKADSISLQIAEAKMAWNNAGTVGYIVGTGAFRDAQLSNRSYQPIIYKIDKTVSASATWTLLPALDFNTQYSMVTAHLEKIPVTWPVLTGSAVALPFVSEFDITVDSLNRLHLAAIFMSGYSDHPDSLQYYSTYSTSINPTEFYRWKHIPYYHPYIYDFVSQSNNYFQVLLIDSMSSESPGVVAGDPGYLDNPWDADVDGTKISIDARLQLSRTQNGKYIFFTWAESDSLFTNSQYKYNNLPEVKIKALEIVPNCGGFLSSNFELSLTQSDNNVRSRGTLHYASPITGPYTTTTNHAQQTYSIDVKLPITVTNSNPYSQLTNNQTWFSYAVCSFKFFEALRIQNTLCTSIEKQELQAASFELIPNPTKEKVTLKFGQISSSSTTIRIHNIAGQLLYSSADMSSETSSELNLSGIPAGIYFVSVSRGGLVQTKKIIIE